MSRTTFPVPATFAARTLRWPRLAPRAAFLLQASITLSFLAGSSAPTPLYAVYRTLWGFSATTLTLIFGVYALAVLASLLVAGRLSDHVGRRPVLLAATLAQLLAMLLFATADSVADLMFARVVQGLSAGAALAAVGAGLLDLDKRRGAVANSVAPMLGTALGGVVAGLMVQYLPFPTHLVYALLGAVFVLQASALLFMPETAARQPGAWASLRPRLNVPAGVRGALWLAAPAIVAVWSLAGFYASLGPTLLRALAGGSATLLGGVALFVLAGSGALSVLALQQRATGVLVRVGALALLGGVAIVMAAVARDAVGWFLIGTAIAGVGFGTGFQGALRSVVAQIGAHERAGVLSVLFILSYLAMGVPAMAAGYGLAQRGNVMAIAEEFGAAVIGLALLALGASLARRP